MKATQREFGGMAARAAADARIFFFCGPDEAGAFDAAARIVELLAAPGERIELSGAELRKDPVRLGDEARSTSLFGDTRHILVRAAGDEAHDAVANLLEDAVESCPVLILASGATDKSRTARLLATRADALVAMFYAPDLETVAAAVRRMAGAAGLRMDTAIATRLARAANLDTRVAQSEIDKLALYLDVSRERPGTIDAAAVDAITASTDEDGFAPLVAIVLGGVTARLGAELLRIRELRLNPVGALLACERRAAQLATLAARLGPRSDIGAFIRAESGARRIFFRDAAELEHQLRQWHGKPLERLIPRLIALHRKLLGDSQNAELTLEHGLTEITRAAGRRN